MNEKPFTRIARCDTDGTTDTEVSDPKRQEGGSQAWLTVFGSFLVYYSSYGLLNSFGFFQDFYQTEYLKSTSPSTISFIGTLQLALMYVLSTISGAICDSHGVQSLYICSGLGITGSFLALSFCKPVFLHIFLTQGLLMGSAIAFSTQPALTVVGQHFERKRALAMGIVAAGAATGGVCFSIMFAELQPIVGFSWTMRIAAMKVVTCYLIALMVSSSKPFGKGIHVDQLLDYRGFLDVRYAVLAAGRFIAQLGLWIPGFYIKPFVCTMFPEATVSKYFIPLQNGASIPGVILGGLLGDQIGRLNVLWPLTLISGLLCLLLWLLSTTVSMLLLFICLFGLTSGTALSLFPPVLSQITPNDKIGARIGACYSLLAIASLLGGPISGTLIGSDAQTKEDYTGLIIYTGTTLSVASLVYIGSRLLHDRKLRAKW